MTALKELPPITDLEWSKWEQKLRNFLPRRRYRHCLRVAAEAAKMARHYGLDEERARLAGLLHDIARDLSFDMLLAYADRFDIMVGAEENANPIILHAPVGAALIKNEWGIADEAVLQAIALHTVAAPGMDDFCQLIYLADIIEPGRKEWPGLEDLRGLSYRHLGRAMLLALQENINYLKECHTFIHPRAVAAYDFWAQKLMEEESSEK